MVDRVEKIVCAMMMVEIEDFRGRSHRYSKARHAVWYVLYAYHHIAPEKIATFYGYSLNGIKSGIKTGEKQAKRLGINVCITQA